MGDLPNLKFTAPLVSRISELEAEVKRLAADCDAWEKRSDRVEAEVERLRETTLYRAADIFVGNALENDSPNFRTHTALVGDETWEITVRRADGKTPDQIIHKLRAEVERLREAIGATIARAEHQGCNMAGCDSEWHSPVCPLGVIEPLNAALEPQS